MPLSIFLAAFLAAAANDLAHASSDGSLQQGPTVKEKMPWYHSGDELHTMITELSKACPSVDIDMSTETEGDVTIDVLKIKKSGASPKTKAVFVFGEHARELITGESALNFIQTLCGQTSESGRASKVLDDVEFTVVPNANPISRKLVEEGQYCKRTNEDGVDLNRNWSDKHRDQSTNVQGDEMNPGPRAFSEPETRLIKGIVDNERPDIYLSIHSGAYLLGTPLGYTPSTANVKNQAEMQEVLKPISEKYCGGDCPFGDLAQLINYNSVGCDIDYVSEKLGVPFVYTWEIYVGSAIRTRYIEEARERRNGGGMSEDAMLFFQSNNQNFVDKKTIELVERSSHLKRQSGKSAFKSHLRSKSKTRTPEADEDVDGCMDQFNPETQEETQAVAENWSGAYLMLCEQVIQKRNVGVSATTGSTASAGTTPGDSGSAAATDSQAASAPVADAGSATSTSVMSQSTPAADNQPSPSAAEASSEGGTATQTSEQTTGTGDSQSTLSPREDLQAAFSGAGDYMAEAKRLEHPEDAPKPGLEQLSTFLAAQNGQTAAFSQGTDAMQKYWNSA